MAHLGVGLVLNVLYPLVLVLSRLLGCGACTKAQHGTELNTGSWGSWAHVRITVAPQTPLLKWEWPIPLP